MAATTDRWTIRTNNAPPIVPKSALGGDDQSGLHASGIAWYAIVVAVEHLEFMFSAMRATGTLYPTTQMTALRTEERMAQSLSPRKNRARSREAVWSDSLSRIAE